MIARFTHRRAHSLGRRLLDAWRGRFVGGLGKSQQVFFVRANGRRYKRVIFGDSALASEVVEAMAACRDRISLPELIHQHENELWLEFVEGRAIQAGLEADRKALAECFAALHAAEPVEVALADTRLVRQLETDLNFLHHADILSERQWTALRKQAVALAPDRVWLGLDYIDPVLKNFVSRDGRIVIIDLESLARGCLLGTGIAKSTLHWLDQRDTFAGEVIELGAPDFRPQLDFAHLALLSGWTKRKLLSGKRSRIKPALFDRFSA